jgi:hypothetical protein
LWWPRGRSPLTLVPGIVGSNPTRECDSMFAFLLYVLSCVGRGLRRAYPPSKEPYQMFTNVIVIHGKRESLVQQVCHAMRVACGIESSGSVEVNREGVRNYSFLISFSLFFLAFSLFTFCSYLRAQIVFAV